MHILNLLMDIVYLSTSVIVFCVFMKWIIIVCGLLSDSEVNILGYKPTS